MSRWRPPPPRSTPIITRAGMERLKAELDELWHRRRPEVVKALAAAAAEGDRSENAEYIYRKKQLAEIDRRVRYLGKRIPALKVAETRPRRLDSVFFGATVQLYDLDADRTHCYRIVGADEIDSRGGTVSIDAPLARALLGRKLGDEIRAELPRGTARFEIESIDYPADSD
ncbi:MAG TPA: transcription elongation factor GreB [Rhodanobacteraceae bacterium]|nr:transcription elongation factor GreB [Rhodanobacteraceae bacterium]